MREYIRALNLMFVKTAQIHFLMHIHKSLCLSLDNWTVSRVKLPFDFYFNYEEKTWWF
jgi:hypothetical protein